MGKTSTRSPRRTAPDDAARDRAVVPQPLGLGLVGGELGCEPALRPQHELHGQAEGVRSGVELVLGGERLEQLEQRRAVVPGRAGGAVDDVVALERGHGQDVHIVDAELGRDFAHVGARIRERSSAKPSRSILLTATITCGTRSSATTERCRRVCSSTPLRPSISTMTASAVVAPVTMLRVYCTCPGQSARMKPRAGREVAVGDVDRDALLALGAEAVGEEREVERRRREAPLGRGAGDLLELVGEDRLGVVEQAPDEGGLAVVDGAGGREAEQGGRPRSLRGRLRTVFAAPRCRKATKTVRKRRVRWGRGR